MGFGEIRELTGLQKLRSQYQPQLPPALQGGRVKVEFGDPTVAADSSDYHAIAHSFPLTYGKPLIHLSPVNGKNDIEEYPAIRVGLVFSGRQSPGGHNVIWGLHDAIKSHNSKSTLLGFVGGTEGLFAQKTLEVTDDILMTYCNQGGYDLLGRTKDQIRTTPQVNAALAACQDLKLDGLVIIGGITSNTDAAQLAETFVESGCQTKVIGIPVTLNGDLKNQFVETDVGFDTICKVNAQLISNVCTDALSAEACFDSQFHTTIPPHIYTYPIDPKIAKSNRLRKYGFHGISYAFITRAVAQYLEKDVDSLNMIALHLGSGASACAIKGGKSWDTSMGLTPLAGLPGATRSGSVDPSLVFHYASDVGKLSPASTKHLHISRAEEILNKESGWKSMTGTTNFGVVAESDEPTHRLAFEIFVDRIAGFVGSYFVTLEGRVDALVFAGGIGEHSAKLRSAVVERVACLGFALDDASNQEPIKDVVQELGKRDARQRVLVCQTDEQLEMARLCAEKEDIWE